MLPIDSATLPRGGKLGFGYQRTATHRHQGIDLPRPEGTPVRAAAAGRVTHASDVWEPGFSGYGAHVVIEHDDGTFTLYAHLQRVDVARNEPVEAGEQIGTVGRTEFARNDHGSMLSSGPHLHFEVSPAPYPQGSEAPRIDPLGWLHGAVSPAASGTTLRSAVATSPAPAAAGVALAFWLLGRKRRR